MEISALSACGLMSALAAGSLVNASTAEAKVHLGLSWNTAAANVPLESTQNQSLKASVDLDITEFMRVGVSYSRDTLSSVSYRGPIATPSTETAGTANNPSASTAANSAVGDGVNVSCPSVSSCTKLKNDTFLEERGFTLTFIAIRAMIKPYILLGAGIRNYRFSATQNDQNLDVRAGKTAPYPKLGLGLLLDFYKNCSLRLEFETAPAKTQKPGDERPKALWDRRVNVGLNLDLG